LEVAAALATPRSQSLAALAAVALALAVAPGASASPPCANDALRTAASAQLPDCRAYEQVSPVEKNGQDATPLGVVSPVQAAPSGEALAYTNFGAFTGSAGSTAQLDGHLATRTPGGWQTVEVTPPKPLGPGSLAGYIAGYDYSDSLSTEILKAPLALPGTGAIDGLMNLFVRPPGGGYSWINSVPPPVPPREGCSVCIAGEDEVAFAGASADFSHILFEAEASLAGGAPEGPGIASLYEWHAGAVRFVGVLPDGSPTAGSSEPGAGISPFYSSLATTAAKRVARSISDDGSRVVFAAAADGGPPEPAQSGKAELYDRIAGTETIELSAPAPGAKPSVTTSEPARFWSASSSGRHVFFTSRAELTTDSNTGAANNGEDLYEYDLETHVLHDLTVDANPLDAAAGAGVLGVVGVSGDGSYVYFVARGQLTPGEGVDGQPNLYLVRDRGAPQYIATLASGDAEDWSPTPARAKSYVTPDGRHLELMSLAPLPAANFPGGYDNTDQATGEPDSEVYEYVAQESGRGALLCVSCDRSGNRPLGGAFVGATRLRNVSTPFHQPRVLSDDGTRLFFASPDPLGGEAVANGSVRVYEHELADQGSCAAPGGCVYLLSGSGSGSGSDPGTATGDVFLDADPSGDNVFLATTTPLGPSDQDALADVYDARVDGGFPAAAVEPECGGACRLTGLGSGAGTEEPTILTATLGPSGNLAVSHSQHAGKHHHACARRRAHRRPHRRCAVRHRHRASGRAG
jgi:hypothetical protein